MNAEDTKTATKNLLSIFGVLAFIALVLVGAWSAYQVIKFSPRLWGGSTLDLSLPSLSGIFGSQKLSITPLDDALASGTPFTLQWETSGKFEGGVFSFAYACRNGFYFEIEEKPTDGNGAVTYRPLPCNAPYSLPDTDRAIILRPVSNANRFLDVAFAITYTDANGESLRDTVTATVENKNVSDSNTTIAEGDHTPNNAEQTPKDAENQTTSVGKEGVTSTSSDSSISTTTTVKKTVKYVTVPVYPQNDPYGTADLAISIAGVGVVNPYTGAFEARSHLSPYERGAVKIVATNNGTKETGQWYFIAQLPTRDGYTFTSDPQQSILPTGRTEIIVSFDQLAGGARSIAVQADPQNYIRETNEYNNYASTTVNVY